MRSPTARLALIPVLAGVLLAGCGETQKTTTSGDGTQAVPASVQSDLKQRMGSVTGPGSTAPKAGGTTAPK